MVNIGIIIIGIVLLIAIVAIVATLGGTGRIFGGKPNNVPNVSDQLAQTQLPIISSVSTNGLIGFNEPVATSESSADQIKNNLATGNLVTENSLRKLNDEIKDTVQVNTLTDGGVQTQEKSSLSLVKTPTTELRVIEAFRPAGEGEFASIRGTRLAPTALVRTEETFSGVITTREGTREIRGSKALFERLEQNLLNQ